jgi:hypothetical protein
MTLRPGDDPENLRGERVAGVEVDEILGEVVERVDAGGDRGDLQRGAAGRGGRGT